MISGTLIYAVRISPTNTVSFHTFKSQNYKLRVSNPKRKYVVYLSVLSRISNCQGLGRKNKFEILKTDRTVRSERFDPSKWFSCYDVRYRYRFYITHQNPDTNAELVEYISIRNGRVISSLSYLLLISCCAVDLLVSPPATCDLSSLSDVLSSLL